MIIAAAVLGTLLCVGSFIIIVMIASLHSMNIGMLQRLSEIHTMSNGQMKHYETLSKYVLNLSVVVEKLSETNHDLSAAMYENSFKVVRDGSRMFGGFSAEEVAEKMNKENYELSDDDVRELRDLFMGIDDAMENEEPTEDGEDGEEAF